LVVYEPAARKSTADKPVNLLCLELSITNQESSSVHLNKVTLSFSAPPSVPGAVIPVPTNWWPPGGSGVHIPPGETAVWNFLREGFENDTVVLPSPAPGSLTLSLFFDGFSSPRTATRTLRIRSPTTAISTRLGSTIYVPASSGTLPAIPTAQALKAVSFSPTT
jgi:hypothetical protein